MQNYGEGSHPHTEASASWPELRQALVVAFAAVLVGLALALFALLGARLDPGGGDCVLTDNAGCIETGRAGFSSETAVGAGPGRGD